MSWSRARIAATVTCLTLALFPIRIRAQEPVPVDPAATLYRAAQTLEAERSYDLADALMDYILRRYPDSEAASSIRVRRSQPGTRRLDSRGRTELVVWSTLYGLWLGVAVPGMLGAEEAAPYGLGLLVGGPVGFASAMSWSRRRPISDGAASAMTFGGTWGTWQGYGWAMVLGSRRRCDTYANVAMEYCYDDDPSGPAVFGSMVAGGVAGLLAGSIVARTRDISPGQATTASLGASWGIWYGYALSVLSGLDDSRHGAMTSALVGGDLGLLVGAAIARPHRPTRSAARIVSIAGVAGGLAGLGIDLIVQPESDAVMVGIPAAASAVGLLAASAAMRTRSRADDERAEPDGGRDWELGGPIVPVLREDGRGRMRPALGLTLLSARF